MNRILIFCILSCYLLLYSACRKKGCTDRNALNFDPSATESDGSCRYGSKADELSFTGNCDKGDTTLVSLDSVYNECTLTCFGEAIKYKFSLFIASSVDGGTITTLSDTTPKNIYWGGDAERTLLTFRSRKVLVPDYPKVLTVTYTFESTNPMGEKLTQSCKRSYRKMAGSNITKVQNVKLYGSKATGPQFYSFVKMRGVPKDSGDLMPSFIDLAFSDHSDIGSTFFLSDLPRHKMDLFQYSFLVRQERYLFKESHHYSGCVQFHGQ